VNVAAELDVHDAQLGRREGERQQPPGRSRRGAQGRQVADVPERERKRAHAHRGDQCPHARATARAQPRTAAQAGHWSLFDGGYTFASKIASAAAEFSAPLPTGAYIAAGFVLFALTFIVNALARLAAGGRVSGG